jgi:hypothetical protein
MKRGDHARDHEHRAHDALDLQKPPDALKGRVEDEADHETSHVLARHLRDVARLLHRDENGRREPPDENDL